MTHAVLDLRTLPAATELSPPVAEAIALAASVVLERIHGSEENRYAVTIHGPGTTRGEIRRVPVDEAARATYADLQEATEEGAEGIAVIVARRVLDRIVFRRLPKALARTISCETRRRRTRIATSASSAAASAMETNRRPAGFRASSSNSRGSRSSRPGRRW